MLKFLEQNKSITSPFGKLQTEVQVNKAEANYYVKYLNTMQELVVDGLEGIAHEGNRQGPGEGEDD